MTATSLRLALAAAALLAPALHGTALAQVPQDSTLFEVAAVRARLVAAQDEQAAARTSRARPDPTLTRYLDGVAALGRHQFDSALVPLQAAAHARADNARYHGDLGYALAGLGRWDEAATEYETAARLQADNPWYDVGLGAVRARQERWPEARTAYERAVALDSSVIDRRIVAAVTDCMDRGRFDDGLITWARLATVRYPNDPAPWLRLALLLRQRDSVQGMEAARRFRALAPDHLSGAALFASYLVGAGQYDSSLALAGEAAEDSTLWPLVWPIYLKVGAHLFQARDFERASAVLEQGRRFAPDARQAQFSLFLGYANVQRLGPLYADAARKQDCGEAHAVDSLEVSVRHDLEAGKAVGDSTQINQILTGVLTQARTRIDEMLNKCRKP